MASTRRAIAAATATRRSQAVERRQAGEDLLTIGRALRYGKWKDHGEGSSDRWEQESTDKVVATMVGEDIKRALADRRAGLDRSVTAMREDMLDRLERLHAAAFTHALGGSAPHIRECARLNQQIARLQALDAPIRHEVDVKATSALVEEAVADLMAAVKLSAVPDEGVR